MSAGMIDATTLQARVGRGHRLIRPIPAGDTPVLEGRFFVTPLRHGASMHCTDVLHLRDLTTQYAFSEASVKILLKLEGNAQIGIGRQTLALDAGEGAAACPRGAVMSLPPANTFHRHSRAGTRQRMVVLTLRPAWFDAAGLSRELFTDHLSIHPWQPSPRAVAIAEQLINPIDLQGTMRHLHQESRALELIAEALSHTIASTDDHAACMPAGDYRRVRRLQQFLDSGAADQLDMRAIALHIGCNPTTLSQQFREACGQSIFDYLRHRRLQRAADALRYQGVSVARAAEIAGYSSQANFSTAFRRHFGLRPKHCRVRL